MAHVHELNTIIAMYLPELRKYIGQVDRFIAVSQLVRDELVERWGVPLDRITVVYEFSEVGKSPAASKQPIKDKMVVGGSGLVHWRKGHDLFIQVAHCLRREHPDVPAKFVWVGRLDAQHKIIVQADLERSGFTDRVQFVGELEDPLPAFREMDVILLTSREDPFPLVCIEVGMLGTPLLCFQGATGIPEVLADGGGFVVPYLDVSAMADHIAALWHDSNLRMFHSEKARAVFSKFTPEDRCPPIGTLIDEMLQG
ncbi:MAG: glycosyltransferase family 4 protein [Flavobacteriales bacterium]|nr:glycosyltransferase family 4 protein [Flavobacteriales bacterium]